MRTLLFTLAFIAAGAGTVAAQPAPMDGLEFRGNGAHLTRPARRALGEIAEQLRAQPALHVHFTVYGAGGADPLVLATARADAIAAFLTRRGVAARRIHAFGVREVSARPTVRWSRERATPPRRLEPGRGADGRR